MVDIRGIGAAPVTSHTNHGIASGVGNHFVMNTSYYGLVEAPLSDLSYSWPESIALLAPLPFFKLVRCRCGAMSGGSIILEVR